MEDSRLEVSGVFSVQGENLTVDVDLYDVDNSDVPDPGLLSEKNEVGLEVPQVLQLFTSNQRWRNMSLRARARQLWLHLRMYLHDVVEKEKRDELRVARLTHGLEPVRFLGVAAGLCSVAQDPVGRRFMVLDGAGYLHQHTKDGWVQKKLQAPVALTGLVTVLGPLGEVGRFVGWGPAGLAILGPDFNLLWLRRLGVGKVLSQEPTCCLPVPSQGLLLVSLVGGSLELWKFRSGGRRLVPGGLPLKLPPGLTGTFRRLALGPEVSYHVSHCFAALGSAVITFDLDSWALVDVCKDLHKTTISDLEYCKEVEAMVTASRDSTVKVWETDWQIRIVFVGHTGPVTAMTVIPNTALVLSASQDGTLRTWNLQAMTQVGEVSMGCWGQNVLSRGVNRLLAPAGPGWPVLSLCSKSVELWRLRELYSPLALLSAPVLHMQVAPVLPAPADPSLPARLVCACADGSVYLVSTTTGRTVSTLLLEPEDCAVAVAYCLPREALWVLTQSGHLLRVNAARCPMVVLHRLSPKPPPAPRPCCLHLYSHLTDARSAFSCWEIVHQHQGDLHRSAFPWAWKNKNRFLPVMGHSDGSLSVLDGRSSVTVFHTEAHSPGPVTAIASTWNIIVSSGGDLTVKMWRVFPYAEESLSLLRTFSCCHPVVTLCALGKRITVGFEDPESATYGLVQFGQGDKMRCDHRPQDDPLDHITSLSCCPTLKLYACSSLDCTVRIWTWENHLLRLLQLDGPPEALAFCSNSGDLVLVLGSRLCLVSHRLYLPTSYLVKNLCQKIPDVVDDRLLTLTNQTPITSSQLQRLTSLHGAVSVGVTLPFIKRQAAIPQQSIPKEDLEDLIARDQDLQQLRQGLVVPAARPPPNWKIRQKAFSSYLHLIYGSDLLSGRESLQWTTAAMASEREAQDMWTQPRTTSSFVKAVVSTEFPPVPPVPPYLYTPGFPGRRFARPPRVTLPIPPLPRQVHSQASKLLASSSLSSDLGLSLDLQLQSEWFRGEMTMLLSTIPSSLLKHRVPLLLQRRPKNLPSLLGGFFPRTVLSYKYRPRPINFPGCVPNSVVLQKMWSPSEISSIGSLAEMSPHDKLKSRGPEDRWPKHYKYSGKWRKLINWLNRKTGEEKEKEEEEEEEEDFEEDWISSSLYSDEQLESWDIDMPSSMALTLKSKETRHFTSRRRHSQSLWEERYGHLPKFLHFFVLQNWFKKMFPIFSLKAYPEMGTIEGLASMLMDFLPKVTWADRVHILQALLRLLPDVSGELRTRLQRQLLYLLNLDEPPSLLDPIQKQFVMLAMQLLLACTLETGDVVAELMAYFLYSPANCQEELKTLLDGLGLHDPQGFLVKEMMTWVRGSESKAELRERCHQKLEEMIQELQSASSYPPAPPKKFSQSSMSSESSSHTLSTSWTSSRGSDATSYESELPSMVLSEHSPTHGSAHKLAYALAQKLGPVRAESEASGPESQVSQVSHLTAHLHTWRSTRTLSATLQPFCSVSDKHLYASVPSTLRSTRLPLEQTKWSHRQLLDLCHIDALNYFCEQRTLQQSLLEGAERGSLMVQPRQRIMPNIVVRPPREHWPYPIVRLQEGRAKKGGMTLKGRRLFRPTRMLDGPVRVLKLPMPRVELQPFPPGWPTPPRAMPPLLLQPTLQRYFLPQDADPDTYG